MLINKKTQFLGFILNTKTHQFHGVATYPSMGGRLGAHGCVFHGRKMHGVATNVYSRETSEKPERVVYEL